MESEKAFLGPTRQDQLLPDEAQRNALLHQTVDEINSFYATLDHRPVQPRVRPEAIREYLHRFDFENEQDSLQLVGEVADRLKSWQLHTPHPRYFGLFNPSPGIHAMVADLLVAGFNPQLGAWHHSPFAVELEAHVIRFFSRRFGLDHQAFGNFTSGGSEANFSAVVVALTRMFPSFASEGVRSITGQPTLYCSREFHHSFVKIAHQCGLGRQAVRLVPVTDKYVMDTTALRKAIDQDLADGARPFLVVGTAGTTNAGLIEPLGEMAAIAQEYLVHFHVDAAWGGALTLSDRHRHQLQGIERADSITFDPHKLLSVTMGAGMFLVRERGWLRQSFGLITEYVPESPTADLDNYRLGFQFSRRFIGLKLFMALASMGRKGLAKAIDHQLDMATLLASKLESNGFQVVNGAANGVVCFVPPERWNMGQHDRIVELAEAVCHTGTAWISATRLAGRAVLRACITNHLTQPHDLDQLVATLLGLAPKKDPQED